MIKSALFWFLLTFFFIFMESFYSMMEMALVSFNKIRLQYYLSKKDQRAIWIHNLLKNPSTLFGTTLFGVNIALQLGSECSRQFYETINLNPNIAPITQVIFVLIFAELSPIFAARNYAEHVSRIGIPLIYLTSIIVKPFLWIMRGITKITDYLIGTTKHKDAIFITREELQKVIEEQDEDVSATGESQELNLIASNIFSLREKSAIDIMEPLEDIPKLPSNATIKKMRSFLKKYPVNYLPIYHRDPTNIIGIAIPRDLIKLSDDKKVRDYARQPWFITSKTKSFQILKQFRRNNQTYAVVLNSKGQAIGILTLEEIVEEVFGERQYLSTKKYDSFKKNKVVIDLTLPGKTLIDEFNKKYHTHIEMQNAKTFSDLFTIFLGRLPEKNESIYLDTFEITAIEVSLLEVKMVHIKTKLL